MSPVATMMVNACRMGICENFAASLHADVITQIHLRTIDVDWLPYGRSAYCREPIQDKMSLYLFALKSCIFYLAFVQTTSNYNFEVFVIHEHVTR